MIDRSPEPNVHRVADLVRSEMETLEAASNAVRDAHLSELLATWARERQVFLSRIGAAGEIPATAAEQAGPEPALGTRARMYSRRLVGGDSRVLQSVRYAETRVADQIEQEADRSLPDDVRVLTENLVRTIRQVVDDITTRLGERVEPRR